MMVLINLKIRRYKCPDCGYVFPDEFNFYKTKAHITNRLKQEFIDRCLRGETYLYIAKDYSVSDKTVSAAFMEYAQTHLDNEMFCNTESISLSVRRRCTFVYKDFTEGV